MTTSEREMAMPWSHDRRPIRVPRRAAGAAVLLVALAGCSSPSGAATSADAPTPTATAGAQGRPGAGAVLPGARGLVAAISGRTMQVQSQQSGQVAVTWTTSTRFTRTVAAAPTVAKVGSCVTVRPVAAGITAAPATPATAVTAESVEVTPAVDGSCDQVRVGDPGAPGGRPSGAPSGALPGGRGPGVGASGIGGQRPVAGRITAVAGGTLTVAAVTFGAGAGSTATPSTVTVSTTSTTTWTRTVPGAARDLAVGQCVTALGTPDDTGAVTASAVASRPATNGQCDDGFTRGTKGSS